MHNDNADAVRISKILKPVVDSTGIMPGPPQKTEYIQPTLSGSGISPRLLQKINPSGPVEYNKQTEPVLVQTEQGPVVVAAPSGPGGTSVSLPQILRAELPADQKAYKPHAIPALNIQGLSEAKEIETTAAPKQVTAGVNASGPIFYIVAGLVVLYILSKL